jgi:hypothetical protein
MLYVVIVDQGDGELGILCFSEGTDLVLGRVHNY